MVHHLPTPTGLGAPPWLDRQGKLALMILKHYFNCSDSQLLSRLATDWAAQLFCGIRLPKGTLIRDQTLVSRVRSQLGIQGWQSLQETLLSGWSEHIEAPHLRLIDATCYESYIRYPTDVKLLWECVEWLYERGIYLICKQLGLIRPRSRYRDQKKKFLAYSKLRRKAWVKTRRRKRALLYLLAKGLRQLQDLLDQYASVLHLRKTFFARIKTIRKVLRQQRYLFNNPSTKRKPMGDRIVSLAKPYIHPIVRGKESKPVEFGCKVHVVQVGGLNFIEHLSSRAFHEGKRLKRAALCYSEQLGLCRQLGADRIYATNKNRLWLTKKKITTCFPQKGPKKVLSKPKKAMRQLLAKARATRLEGSFGNEKNHYGLNRVRARTYPNEAIWIFFGMMTANAVKILKRQEA